MKLEKRLATRPKALPVFAFGLITHLSAMVFSTQPANAQEATPLPPARLIDEGLRREAQRAQEQVGGPVRDVLRPTTPRVFSQEIPKETPCFDVQRIELIGSMAHEFRWLQERSTSWLNHCLGGQGLRQLTGSLDAALLEAGFITSRVTLPEQNLATGTLRINVHAGRISEVQSAPGLFWESAFPIAAGDILSIRDLDQGVEQMGRLHSRVIQTQLEPGSEPDTSLVRIWSKPGGSRLRGGLTMDNSGPPDVGRPHASTYVVFDDPTGLNDLISVGANTNLQKLASDNRSQSMAVNYSVPWGYSLFTFSAYTARLAQRVQLTTASVVSSGRSRGVDLRWDRILWRNQSSKLGVFAGASHRRSNSFLEDVELTVQRRRNTFANLGANYKHFFQRASIDAEISLRKGIGGLGAEPDFDSEVSKGLTLRPQIWGVNVALDFADLFNRRGSAPPGQLVRPIGLRSSMRLQYTKNAMLALDQFSIGSRSTVRGFSDSSTLAAESGFAWRNELTMPMQLGGLPVLGFLAVDFGRVWGTSSGQLIGKKLAGAALGLRSQWRHLYFEASVAAPLSKPSGFRSARASPFLSLTYMF